MSHTYTSPGTFTATLLNSALTGVATATIVVGNSAPKISRSESQPPPPRSMPVMTPLVTLPTGCSWYVCDDTTRDASDEEIK